MFFLWKHSFSLWFVKSLQLTLKIKSWSQNEYLILTWIYMVIQYHIFMSTTILFVLFCTLRSLSWNFDEYFTKWILHQIPHMTFIQILSLNFMYLIHKFLDKVMNWKHLHVAPFIHSVSKDSQSQLNIISTSLSWEDTFLLNPMCL